MPGTRTLRSDSSLSGPFSSSFCTQSEVLTGNPGQLEDVYESLDPGQHTLACLAVLAARWATPDPCL
jgi:hypothetical protein